MTGLFPAADAGSELKLSSVLINTGHTQARYSECARLIPGEIPASHLNVRKPPRSVRPVEITDIGDSRVEAEPSETLLKLLIPHPLRSRTAWEWLRSMVADCTLIALGWLSVGILLLPVRLLFPHFRPLGLANGSYVFLLGIALLHAALITLVGHTEGLYECSNDLRAQATAVCKAVLWGSIILCLAYGFQGAHWTVSPLVAAAGVLHFGSLLAWRYWTTENEAEQADNEARNVLIVGAGKTGRRVAAHIERYPGCRRRVCGFLDDEKPLGGPVIGRVSDLARMARKGFVDEVILAGPRDGELALWVMREAKRLRLDLEIVPELFGCDPAQHEIDRLAGLPVICVHAERLPAAGLVLKRTIDALGAALGLIVLAPVMALIAGLIKIDSAGPILYVAKRAGRKGRTFHCYKFRTMVTDADQQKNALRDRNQRSGPIFKIFDDPRITRLGRVLRRYSLDELPQLWNVLRGEMSLVGPRPHPVDEFEAYELGHLGRLDVTPGLTGLWQVSARRDPSFERAIELDREYIRSWSLAQDFKILLKTIVAVVRGSGN